MESDEEPIEMPKKRKRCTRVSCRGSDGRSIDIEICIKDGEILECGDEE
jgi:hypothetical protein